MTPRLELRSTVLGTDDVVGLSNFYRDLFGWQLVEQDPIWAKVRSADGRHQLSFQREESHVRPVWPPRPGEQQMMMHLDVLVDDLDAAVSHAEQLGARQADHQPEHDVRVMIDPAGHPFCLFLPGA